MFTICLHKKSCKQNVYMKIKILNNKLPAVGSRLTAGRRAVSRGLKNQASSVISLSVETQQAEICLCCRLTSAELIFSKFVSGVSVSMCIFSIARNIAEKWRFTCVLKAVNRRSGSAILFGLRVCSLPIQRTVFAVEIFIAVDKFVCPPS